MEGWRRVEPKTRPFQSSGRGRREQGQALVVAPAAQALVPDAAQIDLESGPPPAVMAETDLPLIRPIALGRIALGEGSKVPRTPNAFLQLLLCLHL